MALLLLLWFVGEFDSSSPVTTEATTARDLSLTERPLTQRSSENPAMHSALTHDGASLVIADKDGLWIQQVAGGEPMYLEMPEGFIPGEIVAYPQASVVIVDGIQAARRARWRIDVTTQQKEPLDAPIGTRLWSISPDEKWSLVERRGTLGIASFGEDGSGDITTPIGNNFQIKAATWSHDSAYLAYILTYVEANSASSQTTLKITSRDGMQTNVIVTDPDLLQADAVGGIAGLAWIGSSLIYSQAHQRGSRIWRVLRENGARIGEPVLIHELPTESATHFAYRRGGPCPMRST